MFDDLIATWQELGNMLADVQENIGDMHPDDVIGILDNCQLKATELTQGIAARRDYVQDIRALTPDAGVPPARQAPGVPPVTGESPGLS